MMGFLVRWLVCSWLGHRVKYWGFEYMTDYGPETEVTAYCARCDWYEHI